MPALCRVLFHVGVHRVEPFFDAGIEFDLPALRDEIGAVDADALLLRLFVQEVHVGDQRVGALGLRDARALGPEFLRVDAELRQERVFLHRLRRQRAVEVVDKGDGFFLRAGDSATRSRPPARAIIADIGLYSSGAPNSRSRAGRQRGTWIGQVARVRGFLRAQPAGSAQRSPLRQSKTSPARPWPPLFTARLVEGREA